MSVTNADAGTCITNGGSTVDTVDPPAAPPPAPAPAVAAIRRRPPLVPAGEGRIFTGGVILTSRAVLPVLPKLDPLIVTSIGCPSAPKPDVGPVPGVREEMVGGAYEYLKEEGRKYKTILVRDGGDGRGRVRVSEEGGEYHMCL